MLEISVIAFALLCFFALLGVAAFALIMLAIGLEVADRIEFYTNTEE